jgi:hypothetical protein
VVVVVVFIALLLVPLSLEAALVVAALLLEQLETGVEVLFLGALAAEVAEVLLLVMQCEMVAQVVELKCTPLAAEEPLELLEHQAVLAHNQRTVLALVAEAGPLQLLPMLEVAVLAVLAEVVEAVAAHHKTVLVILVLAVLAVMA